MNASFKTKLLLHLNQKKQESGEQGFTLIELLVVIIIIGILAAIALPSFLNQANKGKQAEGKQYVSSVNKAQQAFYTENSAFATENANAWGSLGVGIKTQTTNYVYKIGGDKNGVWSTGNASLINTALKSYTGVVGLITPAGGGDVTAQSAVCETEKAAVAPTEITVPANSSEVKCDPMKPVK